MSIFSDNEPNRIEGTEGDDVLVGTDGSDVILGLGGNDIIRGLGGDDTVRGSFGDDLRVAGGGGKDEIHGAMGNDLVKGGSGDDVIYAGLGNDTINGGSGDDLLVAIATDENGNNMPDGDDTFIFKAGSKGWGDDTVDGVGVGDRALITTTDSTYTIDSVESALEVAEMLNNDGRDDTYATLDGDNAVFAFGAENGSITLLNATDFFGA